MTVWRVAYETGNAPIPHAEDYTTEATALTRERTLRESGLSRVVVYAAEGDRAAGCWCQEHETSELGESA